MTSKEADPRKEYIKIQEVQEAQEAQEAEEDGEVEIIEDPRHSIFTINNESRNVNEAAGSWSEQQAAATRRARTNDTTKLLIDKVDGLEANMEQQKQLTLMLSSMTDKLNSWVGQVISRSK